MVTDDSVAVDVEGHTLAGPSPLEAVATAAAQYNVDVIVMGTDPSERLEGQIARRTNCSTVVVNDRTPPESIASILVPVAGGPHSGAAVDIAGALAEANDAWIELVHVVDPGSPTGESAQSLLETGRTRLPSSVTVDTRVVEAPDVVDSIEEESICHDLTIIGAPQKGRLRQLIFGSTATDIREQAHNTVVMVRHHPDGTLLSGALSA